MNLSSFKKLSQEKKLGGFLIATTLAWSLGLPFIIGTAAASSLTNISDTLTSSAPAVATNHSLTWITPNGLSPAQTILVTLDPATSFFTIGALAVADFVGETGLTVVGACTAAASEATLTTTATTFTLTMCATDTVASSTTILLPITGSKITNPTTPGSYVIRVGGTQQDSADTRVAIVNTVSMTAKVDTSFTFTITGLATSTDVNGTTTEITTTATQIAFNTLTPGTKKTGAQRLNVTTNAANGFTVTVVQNQNLLSNTGADINLFKDESQVAVPTAWTQPVGTLGVATSYGHYGVTSEDATLTAGDEFGVSLYAGNLNTPRQVFFHGAASNGIAANIGETDVGFQIEVGPLQEAANDYRNTLTYVATPTF